MKLHRPVASVNPSVYALRRLVQEVGGAKEEWWRQNGVRGKKTLFSLYNFGRVRGEKTEEFWEIYKKQERSSQIGRLWTDCYNLKGEDHVTLGSQARTTVRKTICPHVLLLAVWVRPLTVGFNCCFMSFYFFLEIVIEKWLLKITFAV